jgi:hypothetical protein
MMPATDVVTVRKASNQSGNSGRRYQVTSLTVPSQFARDIPDKQKYQVALSDDGALVFIPVEENNV